MMILLVALHLYEVDVVSSTHFQLQEHQLKTGISHHIRNTSLAVPVYPQEAGHLRESVATLLQGAIAVPLYLRCLCAVYPRISSSYVYTYAYTYELDIHICI